MAKEQMHAEIRRARVQEIADAKAKLHDADVKVKGLEDKVTALHREKASLASKAADGDTSALKKRRLLDDDEKELIDRIKAIREQVTLNHYGPPDIAKLEATLPNLETAVAIEAVLGELAELPQLANRLSALVTPVAQEFGQFRNRLHAVAQKALPLLGDRTRTTHLERALHGGLTDALRGHLHNEFAAVGLPIIDLKRFAGQNFAAIMEPRLREFIAALEAQLHAGVSKEGRATFRATRRIGGLLGLEISPGEILSLPLDEPHVLEMIKLGALERIADEKAVSA